MYIAINYGSFSRTFCISLLWPKVRCTQSKVISEHWALLNLESLHFNNLEPAWIISCCQITFDVSNASKAIHAKALSFMLSLFITVITTSVDIEYVCKFYFKTNFIVETKQQAYTSLGSNTSVDYRANQTESHSFCSLSSLIFR